MVMEEEKIISEARRIGIANEIKIRNKCIRKEFHDLRQNGIKYEDAIKKLSDIHFISYTRIEQIIFAK